MENFTTDAILDLSGKNALITGGTKGLGKAMATCLLQNGCNVMLVSRHGDGVEDLTALADQLGRCCLVHTCDITDTEAVVEMVQAAESAMGKIDILINAAGMNAPKMLEDMDDATWDKILDLNLRASFIVTRETVKSMRKHHYGKIINISSMKSILGVSDAGYTAYCASKGAINMLTKHLLFDTYGILFQMFLATDDTINFHSESP